MGKFVDRSGIRYGRLLVVDRDCSAGPASNGARVRWTCLCDCGARTSKTGHELASGECRSCGCLQRETVGNRARTHGMTRSPAYRSWQAAKQRCENPNAAHYLSYGGRGIKMHAEWSASFEAFLAYMGPRPARKTLDRIDPTKGYQPGNCRWATELEQRANKRRSIMHEWKGALRTLREVAELEGLPYTSLAKRFRLQRDLDAAIAHAIERLGRKGSDNLHPPS